MSDDTQQWALLTAGFLGLIAALVFGNLKCEAQRQSCVTACIAQHADPLACRAACTEAGK